MGWHQPRSSVCLECIIVEADVPVDKVYLCYELHDPAGLSRHLGLHEDNIRGCWEIVKNKVYRWVLADLNRALVWTGQEEFFVHVWCKSGRHRSVATALIIEAVPQMAGVETSVIHGAQSGWRLRVCSYLSGASFREGGPLLASISQWR